MELRYVNLREKKEIKDAAANWFHSKWGVYKRGVDSNFPNLKEDNNK